MLFLLNLEMASNKIAKPVDNAGLSVWTNGLGAMAQSGERREGGEKGKTGFQEGLIQWKPGWMASGNPNPKRRDTRDTAGSSSANTEKGFIFSGVEIINCLNKERMQS